MGTDLLNAEQIAALLKPINPSRVLHANGQAHVPAYDVAAHLTRVFGFGNWDTDLLSKELLFEDGGAEGKRWTVGYSATVRLTIKNEHGYVVAHWENGACGDAVNQPSRADAHHLAMTTAISTALKRCAAFGLGDQFGLSLYNKGSLNGLVLRTLVMADGAAPAPTPAPDLESGLPKPESIGNDERQGRDDSPPAPVPALPEMTALQHQIKAHPVYAAMDTDAKRALLTAHAGFEVASIRDLTDDACAGALLALGGLA